MMKVIYPANRGKSKHVVNTLNKEIEFQILVPGRVATLSFLWMDKSQVTIANVHNYGFPERTLHQNLDVCLRLPHPTFVLGDLNLCSERAAAELAANSTNK